MSFRLAALSLALAVAAVAVPTHAQAAESDCRFTQGYWQNRAQNAGDFTTDIWLSLRDQAFYSSGLTYGQVLLVSPRGNAYWILAHQLVAAQANYANGADPTGDTAAALTRADEILSAYTPQQIAALPKTDPLRQELIQLANTLDDWNNGLIGTGLCSGGGSFAP
ncbi:hypothetical protein [Luteimonas panaciterrae]|uniref:hypothetical protein n=1 Tax=Luteimonas panaciterrae TaxID=363885 RepID=UPI001CFB2D6F|nr:hypothetical protein [Luteimonas panaciterrae]